MSDDPEDERIDEDGFCWIDRRITGRYLPDGRFVSREEFYKTMTVEERKKFHAKTFPERYRKLGGI